MLLITITLLACLVIIYIISAMLLLEVRKSETLRRQVEYQKDLAARWAKLHIDAVTVARGYKKFIEDYKPYLNKIDEIHKQITKDRQ